MANRIEINAEGCKACYICVSNCPKQCLREGNKINSFAQYYVEQHKPDDCTACKICALMCPEACITVYKDI